MFGTNPNPSVFLAFHTLTEFLESAARDDVLNFSGTSEPYPDSIGVVYNEQYLTVTQIQTTCILVWRIKVGVFKTVGGELYPGDTMNEGRVESAVNCVQAFLTQRGFQLRRADVAMPRDYKVLQGGFHDFMEYRKPEDIFALKG